MGTVGADMISILKVSLPSIIFSMAIQFLPSIIAFLKRNNNFMNVLMLNFIPWVISLINVGIMFLLKDVLFDGGAILNVYLAVEAIIGFIFIIVWFKSLIKALRGY